MAYTKCPNCKAVFEPREPRSASPLVAKLTIENKRLRQQVARLQMDVNEVEDVVTRAMDLAKGCWQDWWVERRKRKALEKLLHDEPEARPHDDS